jgi:hypothetical protein
VTLTDDRVDLDAGEILIPRDLNKSRVRKGIPLSRLELQLLREQLLEGGALAFPAWPFSWDTVPTFAFPGGAQRYMNATEVAFYSKNFANLLIWGINAECLDANGAPVPASCPDASSHCWCNQSAPETQRWATTMEQNLQAQGAILKAAQPALPVLGYIEFLSAQQYYATQAALWRNASLAPMILAVEALGPIDCFRAHDACEWQGVEYRQWDFRRADARAYFVDTVIATLIDSPHLDGTFLDSIDWWATAACARWPCTADEAAALTAASLQTLDAALAGAAALGKVLSVSSHTSLANHAPYFLNFTALLAGHGNALGMALGRPERCDVRAHRRRARRCARSRRRASPSPRPSHDC